MIHAYSENYTNAGQTVFARMLDYAVCERGMDISEFYEKFLSSNLSERFGNGDFRLIAGMSGVELFYEVMAESGFETEWTAPLYSEERSREYWTGWALAYVQWYFGVGFKRLNEIIPIETVRDHYNPYHEMDIRHFCDLVERRIMAAEPDTNLKKMRKKEHLSQSQLAQLSGIPVRMIQEYEQGRKNINKAQAEYLVKIAGVLGCRVEELLEAVDRTKGARTKSMYQREEEGFGIGKDGSLVAENRSIF